MISKRDSTTSADLLLGNPKRLLIDFTIRSFVRLMAGAPVGIDFVILRVF